MTSGKAVMDLKSLSAFMQTSVTYECTVCKLYFGTESHLQTHHKTTHSKRLKVSLDPQLNLSEDSDYNASKSDQLLTSSSNSDNTQGSDDYSTRNDNRESNDVNSEATQQAKESRSLERGEPLKRGHDTLGKGEEPALKQSKTETDSKSQEKNATNFHQYSDSMEETIEQGHYGYLTDTGFHRFTLDELKKFAVQVVALFKLDESQQNLPSTSQSIPVIQNDITAHSIPFALQQESSSSFKIKTNNVMLPNATGNALSMPSESNTVGNNLDDPNKSCYKCGELGHFAWGCTNPRNREIQPKRKRVHRKRKKGQQVDASIVTT